MNLQNFYDTTLTKVLELNAEIKDISLFINDINKSIVEFKNFIESLNKLSTGSYEEILMNQITKGKIPDLKGTLNFLDLKKLKNLGDKLKNIADTLKNIANTLPKIKDILTNSKNILSTCDDLQDVKDLVIKIKKDTKNISGLMLNINNFKVDKFEVVPGIKTYSRWSHIKIDIPCSGCSYDGNITFPNHHMPYLELIINSKEK